MNVEVVRFPDDVLKKFAEASTGILQKEVAKGPIAAKGGEALTETDDRPRLRLTCLLRRPAASLSRRVNSLVGALAA